jgi:hypothetical protein
MVLAALFCDLEEHELANILKECEYEMIAWKGCLGRMICVQWSVRGRF